jgi:hypothetical protein
MVSTRSSTGTLPRASAPPPDAAIRTPAPKRAIAPRSKPTSASWRHEPSTLTLAWMAISLPLVIWDTGYVLGRPHTMEGGALHWPLYLPYRLYGTVDYVYGWKAVEAKYGFTGAQGFLNLVETLMYAAYLAMYFRGRDSGSSGARAALIGFSAAVMTLSKTVLYWMCEYYGEYSNIGHNALTQLIFLWIIPNGAWLIGPTYMIWDLGSDIVAGLEHSAARKKD